MKHASLLISLFLLFVFTGCTTRSTTTPPLAQQPVVGADAAAIYVFRPSGMGAAVKATVLLDGQEVGQLFVRRYAILRVPPGRHNVKISFSIISGLPDQTAEINCEPNSEHFLLYSMSMRPSTYVPNVGVIFNTSAGFHPMSKEDALAWTRQLGLAFTYGRKQP